MVIRSIIISIAMLLAVGCQHLAFTPVSNPPSFRGTPLLLKIPSDMEDFTTQGHSWAIRLSQSLCILQYESTFDDGDAHYCLVVMCTEPKIIGLVVEMVGKGVALKFWSANDRGELIVTSEEEFFQTLDKYEIKKIVVEGIYKWHYHSFQ